MFGLRSHLSRFPRVFTQSCQTSTIKTRAFEPVTRPLITQKLSTLFSRAKYSVSVLASERQAKSKSLFVALGAGILSLGIGTVYADGFTNPDGSPSSPIKSTTHTTITTPSSSDASPPKPTDENGQGYSTSALENMRVFSGRANIPLAEEIAKCLGINLGRISITRFADGEIGLQVHDNVRGKDVYIIQPTSPPGVNDNLVELILMISTMRRSSANTITAVIPYYGYGRQDRKMQSRVPISAADIAELLQAVGVDRVVAVDLHCGQIQGFFGPRTPCDNLEAQGVAANYFADLGLTGNVKIVSPDAGGVYRAKRFQDSIRERGLDCGLAMIIKQRLQANKVASMDLVGSVDGCDVIMIDDMIDTAGTLTAAAQELRNMGAKRIFAFATHGVFSGPALERIENSVLEQVVVTNTIPLPKDKQVKKIVQLSTAGLLSKAITRIQTKQSVSALFQNNKGKRSLKESE